MKMHLKIATALAAAALTGACQMQTPVATYEPVVDIGRTDMNKFYADLEACRAVATKAEARYQEEQSKEAMEDMLVMLATGALAASYAHNTDHNASQWGAIGALGGLAASAEDNDYTGDFVKFGPRRIVDRCMAGRGYSILNEAGRG